MTDAYERLCTCARRACLHVELVASTTLYQACSVQFRRIELLRLTHDSGNVVATAQCRGLGDRNRAAEQLLGFVGA